MENNKKLKIFSTPWHTMHFHDLFNALKDDADFYMVLNSSKKWFKDLRPIPENAYFVPYYEKGKYDLAILDVDQQCVNSNLGKSKLYSELRDLINDIPVIVINHGCPVYPEFLKVGPDETFDYAEKKCKRDMRQLVGNRTMVVNSNRAASQDEWGWGNPIVHGMNPDEWWDLEKEPRVFTALSPAGCDRYYNRETMNEVSQILEEKYKIILWWAKINVATDTSFDAYRKFLGKSLVYLDTSFRTPMNRGRAEAMLSGCCVVQVEGAHDLPRFAEPGENMVVIKNSPDDIAKKVAELLEDGYQEAKRIGENGRQTAIEKFNYKRYRQDWLDLIAKHIWK